MLSLLIRAGGLLRAVPPILWVALATGALVIGITLYQQHTIDALHADLADAKKAAKAASDRADQWRSTAHDLADALVRARDERDAADAATRELQQDLATQREQYRTLHKRITDAPPEDDGPVAPVLRDAIEGLP